jgi:glycosyltransferase involved in cell wall biosynthesis
MTKFTAKVIHIMTHPPAYDEYSDKPRPQWSWETLNGSWVGIWGYDWADILSIEVTKINGELKHEIWQPDLRSDSIYSQEISPGVIHRLFPAQEKIVWIGLRKSIQVDSPAMIQYFNNENRDPLIFHIGQSVTSKINKNLLEIFTEAKFVFSFHGQITLPIVSLFKPQKNFLAKIHYLREHFIAKKLFKRVSFLTYQSNRNLTYLRYYYAGPMTKITMGIYFARYQGYDKIKCRIDLNLPLNKKILLTLCRLYDLKQVDKVIDILSTIDMEFLYLVVGHGTREYEGYLKRKAKKLIEKNKIIFTGYKTGPELMKYINSADLFIHFSKGEAGPVVSMEAMACGIPVFCTDTGNTAEVLKENNAGTIVGIKNYKDWKNKLVSYLKGKSVFALDTEVVKDHYDWKNIAVKFTDIYIGIIYGN